MTGISESIKGGAEGSIGALTRQPRWRCGWMTGAFKPGSRAT